LGAWGLGWEVWLDGMEVTQFTYFQQVGGVACEPVAVEITYGTERLAMYLQGVESVFEIVWNRAGDEVTTYADVHKESEYQFSRYHFEVADVDRLLQEFDFAEMSVIYVWKKGLANSLLMMEVYGRLLTFILLFLGWLRKGRIIFKLTGGQKLTFFKGV